MHKPTIQIAFDPPIGQKVHVPIIPTSHSDTSSAVLTFTARVGAEDYAAILNDGGRVQLWTDLPFDGTGNGAWQEALFMQPEIPGLASNSYDISMTAQQVEDVVILTAEINILLDTFVNQVFQFTYRIKYDGGRVHWLGDFNINGSLVLEHREGLEKSLTLCEGWECLDHGSWIFQSESECVQKMVIRLTDASRYRIWSLGGDSLLPEPERASMMFLIPRFQESLVPIPTYILSTSPTLAMALTLSDDIAISGTGSLVIQTPVLHPSAEQQLIRLFRKSGLGNWRVLAFDTHTQFITIGSNGCPELIQVAALPLWSSPWFTNSACLPYSNITGILSQVSTQDIVFFSSSKPQIWVIRKEIVLESISLLCTATGDAFVVAPLHPLTKPHSHHSSGNWAASIFSKHRTLQIPHTLQVLPTPPPSPKLVPEEAPTRAAFIPSNPILQQTFQRIAPQSKDLSSFCPSSTQGYASIFLRNNLYAQRVLGLFKSIFTSLSTFLRVFCRFFGGRFQKPSTSHPPSPHSSNARFLPATLPLDKSVTSRNGTSPNAKLAPCTRSPPIDDGNFVAELQSDELDLHLNTATITVALIPLSLDTDHSAIPKNGIERSVVFLDDSNLRCVVSKCSVVFLRRQIGLQPNILEGSCILLEYEVEWQNWRTKRVIEVLSPL